MIAHMRSKAATFIHSCRGRGILEREKNKEKGELMSPSSNVAKTPPCIHLLNNVEDDDGGGSMELLLKIGGASRLKIAHENRFIKPMPKDEMQPSNNVSGFPVARAPLCCGA